MDSRQAANWAQILGTIIGAAILGFVVWDHWPSSSESTATITTWGALVRTWLPPAIIAGIMLCAAVFNIIASRRARQKSESATNHTNPSLEILSPFNNDEVALYETIRGRVHPPDSDLQVLVFARDNKWYPQRSVKINGSKWSAKCQFGNLDNPGSGVYKIIALLGNELREGMWYSDLPSGTPKSNIITVHRPEITIEQKLSAALKDAQVAKNEIAQLNQEITKAGGDSREWERKYHELNRQIVLIETERGHHVEQMARLNRDIALAEEGHKAEVTGINIKLRTIEDDLKASKHELAEANKTIRFEKDQKEIHYQMYQAEKAKYEKLLWVTDIIERQQKAINEHVLIDKLTKVRVYLSDSDIGPPRIRFGFQITNDSLFEIVVHTEDVSGHVAFRGRNMRESVSHDLSVQGSPTIRTLSHKGFGWLFLEQDFTNSEVDRIKNALDMPDVHFGFEDISIEVSGGTRFPDVQRQMLQIPRSCSSISLGECEIKGNTNNA